MKLFPEFSMEDEMDALAAASLHSYSPHPLVPLLFPIAVAPICFWLL